MRAPGETHSQRPAGRLPRRNPEAGGRTGCACARLRPAGAVRPMRLRGSAPLQVRAEPRQAWQHDSESASSVSCVRRPRSRRPGTRAALCRMLARAARAVARASAPAARVRAGARAMSSESAEFELAVPLEYHSEIRLPSEPPGMEAPCPGPSPHAMCPLPIQAQRPAARAAPRGAAVVARPHLSLACRLVPRRCLWPPRAPDRGTSGRHGLGPSPCALL